MEGAGESMWGRMRRTPFSLWVTAGALTYVALAFLVLTVPFAIGAGILGGGGFVLILLLFIVLFLVAAAFSLRQKRWAYILGAATSIVLVLLFSTNIVSTLSNPADSFFWLIISVLPALILVVIFSILSFLNAKTGLSQKKYLATPMSSGGLLTVAVIGFVIGSLVVGAIGAGVILRNIAAGTADVTIVANAASATVPYVPTAFHVAVGGTVTWINKDTTAHTVTSNTSLFDSGLMTTGATWSHTFNQAGTYWYYCTVHPMMVGKVIVS